MIELQHLTKTFEIASGTVHAVQDVTLSVPKGDIFGIIGMSGAGKSTLVRMINMLERPTSGTVLINGQDLGAMKPAELRMARRRIAMIFQGFNLLQQSTCLKNVCFPMELAGRRGAECKKRATELLELVGLSDKADSYPSQLSGGQQQRVAIARALATDPDVLLCDEATSALDPTTTNSILELIRSINEKMGITVLLITHQMQVVETICKHVAIMEHGYMVECGEVSEVFSHPKTDAARRLVFPEGSAAVSPSAAPGSKFIRVVFNGAEATEKPMLARLATEAGIEASIAYASTRGIGKRAYGAMILSIVDENDAVQRAIEFLTATPDVTAEEVDINVF